MAFTFCAAGTSIFPRVLKVSAPSILRPQICHAILNFHHCCFYKRSTYRTFQVARQCLQSHLRRNCRRISTSPTLRSIFPVNLQRQSLQSKPQIIAKNKIQAHSFHLISPFDWGFTGRFSSATFLTTKRYCGTQLCIWHNCFYLTLLKKV